MYAIRPDGFLSRNCKPVYAGGSRSDQRDLAAMEKLVDQGLVNTSALAFLVQASAPPSAVVRSHLPRGLQVDLYFLSGAGKTAAILSAGEYRVHGIFALRVPPGITVWEWLRPDRLLIIQSCNASL